MDVVKKENVNVAEEIMIRLRLSIDHDNIQREVMKGAIDLDLQNGIAYSKCHHCEKCIRRWPYSPWEHNETINVLCADGKSFAAPKGGY